METGDTQMTSQATYGLRIVSRPLGERDEYGIRKSGDKFIALICNDVKICNSLTAAVRYLKKYGYTAFGEQI
jgi:hypothetical protein